jgi:hypothetical protein
MSNEEKIKAISVSIQLWLDGVLTPEGCCYRITGVLKTQ